MTFNPIPVLVWGLGSHAVSRIIPALAASRGIQLAGLLSRNFDKAEAIGEVHGVPAFGSLEEALSTNDIRAVYVASVTASHVPYGVQVLKSGRHLWSEKPVTTDLADLELLGTIADAEGTVVFETDMFLHHPQHLMLRQILESGEYGPVRSLTARFGFPHRPIGEFRYDPALGGGALADAGFYPIAAAIDLLDGSVSLGSAVIASQDGYRVDTDGLALVADTSGTPAVLEWGFGRAYRNDVEVWTEGAVIQVPRAFAKPADFAPSIVIRGSDGSETIVEVPAFDPFVAMFELYVDRIGAGAVGVDPATYERCALMSQIALQPVRIDQA
jgi:NDP-hexose-3-ketoreductase